MVSGILVALLLASVFGTAFYVHPIDANAQVESVERVPSISQPNSALLQQNVVASGQAPMNRQAAFMRLAIQDTAYASSVAGLDSLPLCAYDEQLSLTFTQNFTSIAYNVTAVQQVDSYGYGPAYLLNGVTDKDYWYQVGVSFDWPYGNGGYVAGFQLSYEVWNNEDGSIFPSNGGGGLENFNGSVNNGDNILLTLNFSSGDVVMKAYDWSTGASAEVTYTAVGASRFLGETGGPYDAEGYSTSLMTEWWHPYAYYGGEARVVYNQSTLAISSGWLWADELSPMKGPFLLFSNQQYTSFSNSTQLEYFSTNGASETASGYQFITGARTDKMVHINSDGSVTPSSAPISSRDNGTYVLTSNIACPTYDGLVIERSNIVIDGNGYAVKGNQTQYGVSLIAVGNVTIRDIVIEDFQDGIYLFGSSNDVFEGNTLTANGQNGILLCGSSDNAFEGNNITANTLNGITLTASFTGFLSPGDSSSNNSINGNNITDNPIGISLDSCSDNIISDNDLTTEGGGFGVWLYSSSSNSISVNNITDNEDGIYLESSSDYNTVFGNNITNNWDAGVYLWSSCDNRFFHNTFNDTKQVYGQSSTNVWDDGYPSGGNYWSDYQTRYSNATEIDRSGIWNTPYVIDANNTDYYPLMTPWTGHDVAITDIAASKTIIIQGESVHVNVTLTNEGVYSETFNVTLYREILWGWYAENDTFPLYVFTGVTLTPGSTVTLTVSITLPALPWGIYELKAIAGPVPDQTRVSDLVCTGGYIRVFSPKIHVWLSYGRCGLFGFMPM
jgi:parallel beta-helix repeat protein